MLKKATQKPSSVLPESPIKIFAGGKLLQRKASAAPTSAQDTIVPKNEAPQNATAYAMPIIAVMPAASPSDPSRKLKAFTNRMTIAQTPKISAGAEKCHGNRHPPAHKSSPEPPCAKSRQNGDRPRISSISPLIQISPKAPNHAMGTGFNIQSDPKMVAAASPIAMPTPPSRATS